jgi:hypothetical protein
MTMSTTSVLRPPQSQLRHDRREVGWPRKVLAGAMVVIGGTFVAVTLIVNLFHVGTAFEGLTDGFRPVMTQQSIDTARQDIADLGAAGTEFQTKLVPAMAAQLKTTPAQLTASFATQFPDVTAGVVALPTVVPTFNGLVSTLDQQRPLFVSADAIPTKDLPSTTLPWAFLLSGLLVMGLGVYTWFAPRRGSVLALVLGGLLIAAPLVMSLPGKAGDADQMNTNLKPVYTQQLITQANGALATMSAMGTEMQTKMLPALATQLKMQPAELQAFLGANFPATAKVLGDMPATMARFEGLTGTFQQHLNDYNTLKPVELVPLVRVMIGGGILLLVLGAAGMFLPRTRFATA